MAWAVVYLHIRHRFGDFPHPTGLTCALSENHILRDEGQSVHAGRSQAPGAPCSQCVLSWAREPGAVGWGGGAAGQTKAAACVPRRGAVDSGTRACSPVPFRHRDCMFSTLCLAFSRKETIAFCPLGSPVGLSFRVGRYQWAANVSVRDPPRVDPDLSSGYSEGPWWSR